MSNIFYFILAAVLEISGCYLFWLYMKSGHSLLLLIAVIACQLAFAYVLKRIDKTLARIAYVAYGSIFIIFTLWWMYTLENFSPDIWDFIFVGTSLTGIIILFATRTK